MNKKQIAAIAREYAEWIIEPKAEELPNCLLNEVNELIAENAERLLTWLSTRFCLVEKSKVEEELKNSISLRDGNTAPSIESAIEHNKGIEGIRVLKSLFPEIAKEVEK